jgi:hypothetical protein
MFSCANIPGSTTYWDGLETSEWGISHLAQGVNAVMVDGSARWISKQEVKEDGITYPNHPDYLTNHGERFSNLQVWGRRYATITLER